MGMENAPSKIGKDAAKGLTDAAAKDEEKVEIEKGSDLAKGADRINERSRASVGRDAGSKQM